MHTSRQLLASLILLVYSAAAVGQVDVFPNSKAAISALFPDREFYESVTEEGDWNGDGIKDIAIILRELPYEIRLVVLAGVSNGKFAPLSVSSNYCHAQQFFNLVAEGTSLFVTEVHRADGDALITNTLQFRFNKKLADFELIGKENIWESFGKLWSKEYGRSSENYLTGKYINYERVQGRIRAKEEKRFEAPEIARLNGFDCERYFNSIRY